ncbi:hypothetical protein BCR32DRAFT_268966 [Anaeromyces robustus]|uniref:Transglutaminase-like domain-containing protein n=1 Tax=Anaeromyces robustus TaxID=1754192 RepID=A0A1Y1X386_9FUNG|nr:hypothetical protein BCR32DRAFT_268966 [Anaeromyces robustus]|eukprot:ORX80233.1 hypothetical protein BCR32DRAFT_268966 [Anaeromyces robustus]
MKIFNLILLALVNVWIAFALPASTYEDSTFSYELSTSNKRAVITKVIDKKATAVTIPPFVTVEGQKYFVTEVDKQFLGNTNVQILHVSSDFNIYPNIVLNFRNFAFLGAYNLRTINLKGNKITASAFNGLYGLSDNVLIYGDGTQYLIQDVCFKLLKSWKLPTLKDYTILPVDDMKKDLFTLAKRVKENYEIDSNVMHDDNAAVVFALGRGSRIGIGRVYRNLALYMGVEYHRVQVIADKKSHYAWNFVSTPLNNGTWYFVDIYGNSKNLDCCVYNSDFFMHQNTFKWNILEKVYKEKKLAIPSEDNDDWDNWDKEWVVYNDRIGCEGGVNQYVYPDVDNFSIWIKGKVTVPPKYIFFYV